jgi:uncharacterized protein
MEIIPYVVLGVIAGVLSGMLGVGSGLVLVPALAILFVLPQKSAQGIALAVMVPMALVGVTRYVMNPKIDVDMRVAALVAVGAVVGSLVGAELAGKLPARVLKRVFAIFMVVVAGRILWTTSGPQRRPVPATQSPSRAVDQESAP